MGGIEPEEECGAGLASAAELAALVELAAEQGIDLAAGIRRPFERHVVAGRIRLHCVDWGDQEAPAAILLHAGRMNARTWDLVCLALGESFRCLALDERGSGDSEWALDLDYSVETHARDVVEFADALKIGRFIIVGESIGGIHALACAELFPARVAGLALLDVAAEIDPDGANRQANRMAVFDPLDSFEDFVEMALRERPSRHPERLRRALAQKVRRRADGKWTWKYDARHRSQMTLERFQASFERTLGAIDQVRCPALVLRGEHSDVVTPAAQRALARLLRAEVATVANARHLLSRDNPKGVATELATFFRRVWGVGS